MATQEREDIRRRVALGMRERAKQGDDTRVWYGGGPIPYGYRLERAEKRANGTYSHWLVPDEDPMGRGLPSPANVVRRIFREAGGLQRNCYQIMRGLVADGIPSAFARADSHGYRTRGRQASWSRSSVLRVLQNSAYRGEKSWGVRQSLPTGIQNELDRAATPAERQRVLAEVTVERRDTVPQQWPVLVPEGMWHAANATLKKNQRTMRRSGRAASPEDGPLLRGLVKCAECGRSFVRCLTDPKRNGGIALTWQCTGTQSQVATAVGREKCPSQRIDYDLDAKVWKHVQHRLLRDDSFLKLWAPDRAAAPDKRTQLERQARRKQLTEMKLSYTDDKAQGFLSAAEFSAKLQPIMEELQYLDAQESESRVAAAAEVTGASLGDWLLSVKSKVKHASPALQRELIRRLVAEVRVKTVDHQEVWVKRAQRWRKCTRSVKHAVLLYQPLPGAAPTLLSHCGLLWRPSASTDGTPSPAELWARDVAFRAANGPDFNEFFDESDLDDALIASFTTPYYKKSSPVRKAYEAGLLEAVQLAKPVPAPRKQLVVNAPIRGSKAKKKARAVA